LLGEPKILGDLAHVFMANVEMSRANEGATPAPQEACLRKASAPMNG
jgi:hypothetical protein